MVCLCDSLLGFISPTSQNQTRCRGTPAISLKKPILLLQTRDLGFASQGGPLRFMKLLLLVPISAAVASSLYFFPHTVCLDSLLLAAIPPILWPGVFSFLLVQWNMGFVFQFFPLFIVTLANRQKAKEENANFIVPSSDSKSNNYVKRIFYIRQKPECLIILLKDKDVLSFYFNGKILIFHKLLIFTRPLATKLFYFKSSCVYQL